MKTNSTAPTRTRIAQRLSEIKKLHSQILDVVQKTIEQAARIGGLLTEIKLELPHGEWLP